jgi:hypothetical protein
VIRFKDLRGDDLDRAIAVPLKEVFPETAARIGRNK